MAESESSKSALVVLIVMAGLWVVLLITMRADINIPSPFAVSAPGAGKMADGQVKQRESGVAASGEDEISGEEYEVLQKVLTDFPQLTTVFEAAMVDGRMTYIEADNILARKEALEAEAMTEKQKQGRERLQATIEKLRTQ